jgi:hypothetical protein
MHIRTGSRPLRSALAATGIAAAALGVLTLGEGPALAETSASTASAPATSLAVRSSCTGHNFQGSGGHWGESITCTGGFFKGGIWCKQFDTGYEYQHFGPVSGSGGTSTVYCDLNAYVESWFVVWQ